MSLEYGWSASREGEELAWCVGGVSKVYNVREKSEKITDLDLHVYVHTQLIHKYLQSWTGGYHALSSVLLNDICFSDDT